MNTSAKRLGVFAGSIGIALAGAGAGVALSAAAQDDERPQLRVATYDPQAAFTQYSGAERLNEQMQEFEQEMQQAQQEGDQQKLFELQTTIERLRTEVIEEFFADVERALPKVTQEERVHVVAIEFAYVDESLESPKDLTQNIIEEIN